jgi:hypothetical protein
MSTIELSLNPISIAFALVLRIGQPFTSPTPFYHHLLLLLHLKYHDFWHRSFNTQTVAQDVADVLDEMYVPTTVDDIELFSEKQKFVYAVLESNVQTNCGCSD